jgi:hypothetical protein
VSSFVVLAAAMKPNLRHIVWPVAALAVAGCSEPRTSTRSAEIRGGATDSDDPAVATLSVAGISYCTGSLIAPHTLLTAGHCSNPLARADFGPSEAGATQQIDITTIVQHPMYGGEGKPYDFALAQLTSDPVGIAPLVLNETPLDASDVGRDIRHVGFGVTDDSTGSGGGIKRTVTYPIHRIDGMLVYSGAVGEQTCGGDSGGPGLVMGPAGEVIAAIVSDGPACQLSQDGWDDRVDLVKDWIVQVTSGWDAPPTFGDGGAPHGADAGIDADPGGGADAGVEPHHRSGGCSATRGPGAVWLIALAILCAFGRRRARSTLGSR